MPTPLQTVITLPLLLPPLYVYILYIYNLSIQENERNAKPPLENKNKFRRTARETVI